MPILTFVGEPAATPFQIHKLNDRMSTAAVRDCRELIVVASSAPEQVDTQRLARLLHAQLLDASPFGPSVCVVGPRPGTISPWSSKATDIVERCHIEGVDRVERCRLYQFEGAAGEHGLLFDRMTERVFADAKALSGMFAMAEPAALETITLGDDPLGALAGVNLSLGLALSDDEIEYLAAEYARMGRDPTDAELMMFAQANSEHCRHKIFNASWTIDGADEDASLFGMIRHTHKVSPDGVLSAYSDNAAVIEGHPGASFFPGQDGVYANHPSDLGIMIKVETHNHPTAIAPYPGAATGSGGEIRDEAATGRGAKPKAGLTGFSVSHLRIPGSEQSWEGPQDKPGRIASALEIMLDGPLGAAGFNNEFGRPALGGYFRTFEAGTGDHRFGYHKPIMIAGGMGSIRGDQVHKQRLSPGDYVVVLGGPCMLIGLGGGAASSMTSGESDEALDFASVQRDNPEMQRRCQEVIDRCAIAGDRSPIVTVHDVGAGGLSNAIPELLHDSDRGGTLELRKINSADRGLSPMEIWCNESQERYVVGVKADRLDHFLALCHRERCMVAVVGQVEEREHLTLADSLLGKPPVDLEMSTLFGKPPRLHKQGRRVASEVTAKAMECSLEQAIDRVLSFPAVASKKFLITIGDRSVGGLTARDQMVGKWQVPVADCAVTLTDFDSYTGAAMAMGERTPLATTNAPASGRMAVGEAITNLAGASIGAIGNIKLSANWMAAAGEAEEDARLFDTVRAVGEELCPALGIAIPVGKDSLSMRTRWHDDGREKSVTAPVSLIISGFGPVRDVRKSVTPELATDDGELFLIDLGAGLGRLGGSVLSQVFNQPAGHVPDVDDAARLRTYFECMQELVDRGIVTAYHDRSDGGLIVTLLEMAFAARKGLSIHIGETADLLAMLFNEELGGVVEVPGDAVQAFSTVIKKYGMESLCTSVGNVQGHDETIEIKAAGSTVFSSDRPTLEKKWARVSWQMARLRDNPQCADEEYAGIENGQGLWEKLTFEVSAPAVLKQRPRIAILRDQGVNGQIEMAAAFDRAGFEAVDVHMRDLIEDPALLDTVAGIAACGGFSYGDVLGAGRGWAHSILYRDSLREAFAQFFARPDRFALGVCNGCQMLSALKDIIPGSAHWPQFVHNRSARFEARLSMVEVVDSPSIFFRGMAGSQMPVVVSHGEGRARFEGADNPGCMTYLQSPDTVAQSYPANPNGSERGLAGICSDDGRVTIMMPHPERVFRSVQMSWHPNHWGEDSPWMQMFYNAYRWCSQS